MNKNLLPYLLGIATGALFFLLMTICVSEQKTTAYWHGYRQAMMNVRDGVDNDKNYAYDEKKKGQMPEL